MEITTALLGWGSVTVILAVTSAVTVGLIVRFVSSPVERKYLISGSGNLAGGYASGLEAVFAPSAHEAGIELDRMTKRTAPAPIAGDPPWAIDGDRIRIDV